MTPQVPRIIHEVPDPLTAVLIPQQEEPPSQTWAPERPGSLDLLQDNPHGRDRWTVDPPAARPHCPDWQKGDCPQGENCVFTHDPEVCSSCKTPCDVVLTFTFPGTSGRGASPEESCRGAGCQGSRGGRRNRRRKGSPFDQSHLWRWSVRQQRPYRSRVLQGRGQEPTSDCDKGRCNHALYPTRI